MNKLFILVLVLATISNCGIAPQKKHPAPAVEPKTNDDKQQNGDLPPLKDPVLGLVQTAASMQDKLIAERCLSCHQTPTSGNKYVDLHDLNILFTDQAKNPSGARQIIRKGCPNESIFYSEIADGSMPKSGVPQIDDSDKKIIHDWILSLAPQGTINCSDEPSDDDTNPPVIGRISQLK